MSRPDILLIDVPEADLSLVASGHGVSTGTLGPAYRVTPSASLDAVSFQRTSLPNLAEQDIVVVDFAPPDVERRDPPFESPVIGTTDFFLGRQSGRIDFRPRVLASYRDDLERIYRHGGLFCVFAGAAQPTPYVLGTQRYSSVEVIREVPLRMWDMLSDLSELNVTFDRGQDISPTDAARKLGVADTLSGAFSCVVRPAGTQTDRWIPLATSRYDDCVAGLLMPAEEGHGAVLVAPRVTDRGAIIDWFINDFGPRFAPRLYPSLKDAAWRTSAALELSDVRELREELESLQTAHREAETQLSTRIDEALAEHAWLLDLLNGTADGLVEAVMEALRVCGLEDIRDADAELAAGGAASDKREDLYVVSDDALLLVEVKGIGRRLPSEEEALQVAKYLGPRMKAEGHTNVRGLAIINNERHVPPADRARGIFGSDVVTSAEKQDVGLLQALDLYRLARGVVELDWPTSAVRERFWQAGLLDGRPTHYRRLGTVAHVYSKPEAVSLLLESELRLGDRLGVELQVSNVELEVTSMRLNDQDVVEAVTGDRVGIATGAVTDLLRVGMVVYTVAATE